MVLVDRAGLTNDFPLDLAETEEITQERNNNKNTNLRSVNISHTML